MKNIRTLFIFLLITIGISVTAQVTINTDNSAPDPSAMLDVKSDNRGLLIPRISTAARDLIPSPATGLLIYNSTTNRFDYYNGSFWHQLGTAFISSSTGTLSPGGGVSFNVLPDILPDNSAMLDINDPTRGILIPRISTSARDLISSPATGLIIYNTSTNLLDYYNGSQWIALCSVSTGIPGAGGSQATVGVAVNTDNSNPDPSAMLDVTSSDKGVLIPRLTNAQRDAILPVTGLVIYNTSANYIEFYNGSAWYQLITNQPVPPAGGINIPSSNQIIWKWNTVAGAAGYKWNTVNDYATATDMAAATTKTETGLVCATAYTRYVWAYNDCGFSSALTLTKTTLACGTCASPLVDARDGQSYNTVQIGTQCWMAENLNFGTMIPDANNMTNNSITEKYCYENNTSNCDAYGGLYQWKETMGYSTTQGVQGICPAGWHIPTNDEWTVLTDLLGGEPVAGGEMKTTGTIEAGTGLWHDPNTAATNSSGFSALPGGYRQDGGGFTHLGNYGNFWTSTEVITEYVWFRNLLFHNAFVSSGYGVVEALGYSVRCLKDTPPPVWSCGDPLPDTRDNQTYNTVQIGTQCWMAENLNIGTTIPGATDMVNNSIIEKYCNENNTANCDTYGGLYQWNEMMEYSTTPGVQGICPTGWHVPTDTEWTVLTDFLGGESIAGGTMKTTGTIEAGTGLWYASNNGATNSSGFSAIPGGYRYGDSFNPPGGNANFWSSSEYNTNDAVCRELLATIPNVSRFSISKGVGFSVRCVKDIPPVVWSCGQPLPDTRDNQTYNTVQIGTQCWMAENLNIGTTIPGATDMANNSNTEKYCYEDNAANCDTYGGLYQWKEMMEYSTTPGVQGICPTGWHIPADAEWTLLTTFLGAESIAGGKMKTTGTIEAGTGLWFAPNTGSTNSSGFSALPGGNRYGNGSFYDKGLRAFFWSSTEDQPNFSYRRILNYDNTTVNRDYFYENNGYSVRCMKDTPPPTWSCGQPLPVTHTAGDVAPVNKAVSYGTVETNLTGSNQCWITQNLGSDHQAVSATDATEESAGWYWQFNRKQGYKHDGTTRTPNTVWISSIDENSDWLTANDPCVLLLGAGWRLPTYTEWNNADVNGGWNNYNQTYASVLNLHAAGYLYYSDGSLNSRGSGGTYWSNTQNSGSEGWGLNFYSGSSNQATGGKVYGFSSRCLKDTPPPVWSCGQPLPVTHTAGDVAPVNKAVSYGTVETNLTGSNFCWITQNLGSDHQAVSATDATEESAGWYWQFNRKQGYKHDGTTRTPNASWITSISEDIDWQIWDDPCALSLGSDWRLPTNSEWNNADASGGWNNSDQAYASVLKLHTAGYLNHSNGVLLSRGSTGLLWSSSYINNNYAWSLGINSTGSATYSNTKHYGFSVRCMKDMNPPAWSCGQPLPATHTAGDISPVNKTVAYGTVETVLTGSNKCWITQNLGSDHMAVSATDATEESAGWYWQFNRKQGYKHDGTTRTPNTAWISSIDENSDWLTANDPCTLLLGAGWRLPTSAEWWNVNANGGWPNFDQTYASALKLHAAGFLNASHGWLYNRGSEGGGYDWSSTQESSTNGWNLSYGSGVSSMYASSKAYGFSSRCLKDTPPPVWSCGQPLSVTHTAGDISPVNKTVAYGTVETNLTGSNKCWITQNLGADHQAVSATDATEQSAGWYWQFDRKQGFKNDGTTRTPNTTWIYNTALSEDEDWLPANDPCTLLLGNGWRLPTHGEWNSANVNGGWNGFNQAYASVLKLHAAGYLDYHDGSLLSSGSLGFYFSSSQVSPNYGWSLLIGNSGSNMYSNSKYYGFSSRCLKDTPPPVWSCGDTLLDTRDNQTYNTVQIDTQCWMAENLNIGSMTQGGTAMTNNSITEKYCYQNNTTNCDTYGGLYQWYEMMQYATIPGVQGICPAGWHLPADAEWTTLTTFLGGESIAGGKMKTTGTIEAGTGLWHDPNTGATNSSGLSALPGGMMIHDGSSTSMGNYANFWSSTEYYPDYAKYRLLYHSHAIVDNYGGYEGYGLSVRCVKGEYINLPPFQPASPIPQDNTHNHSANTILSWTCTDPENDPLNYDIYFGANYFPVLVASGQTATSYNPGILENNTLYSWMIVAHDNHSNTTEGLYWSFTTAPSWQCGAPITDARDNQTYTTVQIDTQCWMAENLNFGTMIPGASEMANNSLIEKYCYDDNIANCDVYGGLYQWNEMMDYSITPGVQGICPAGWHVPTDAECTLLTTFLGGESVAGGKMKATGTIEAGTGLWFAPNTGATNESGFTALPGGVRFDGNFVNAGNYATFWSSTELGTDYAWFRLLTYNDANVNRYNYYKSRGYGVRCIKGNTPSNLPPSQPAGPIPPDNAQNQSIFSQPSWSCTDPENDPMTYDVYFGTLFPLTLVSSGQAGTSYNPGILENSTSYYWKIAAHDNNSNTTEGPVWSFTTMSGSSWQCGALLTDVRDFQTYNTVQIGTQCWMAENLNIGTMIPGANNMANNSIVEKYCYDNNIANCNTYGGLYQWNELMDYSTTPGVQGICPAGWHIPAEAEWAILATSLGGENFAGGKMKTTGTIESGTGLWFAPNIGATNSSWFSAIPGGYRDINGYSLSLGHDAIFWSSNEISTNSVKFRYLLYFFSELLTNDDHKDLGFSSRCVKD